MQNDYLDPMTPAVYYNPQINVIEVFWAYSGDVIEIKEFGIGPFYFIGQL